MNRPSGSACRILVLPGMGDIYWVATALQSFIRKHDLGVPDVYVWDFDGRRRSLEYVERIPFVRAAGYFEHTHKDVPEFRESYINDGRCIYPGLLGFDYYLSVNGALRCGRSVEQAMEGYDIDWYFPLRTSEREEQLGAEYVARYGKYIVAHLSSFGMFEHWVKRWGESGCRDFISRIAQVSGMPVLLTGCSWDKPFAEKIAAGAEGDVQDLTGATDMDSFFALFRNAQACTGWCGGNTIMSVYLKKPTLIGWSTYFKNRRFYRYACPPDAWHAWYEAFAVEQTRPRQAASIFLSLLQQEEAIA